MSRREGVVTVFPRSGLEPKAWSESIYRTPATRDRLAGCLKADPAKALVMFHVSQLISNGYAEWSLLDNGDVKLRFLSGEIFLLGDTSITRLI